MRILSLFAGVDGFVAFRIYGDTTGTLFSGGIDRFEEDFKFEFFILFYRFR